MKIGNVRNYNQSFGVKIDSFTGKGIKQTARNIIKQNGENSEKFKQLVEDVKVIVEKCPDTSFFYDMDYDVTRVSIWLRPDNPVDNMKCLGAWGKDDLFSQNYIHYIAKKISASQEEKSDEFNPDETRKKLEGMKNSRFDIRELKVLLPAVNEENMPIFEKFADMKDKYGYNRFDLKYLKIGENLYLYKKGRYCRQGNQKIEPHFKS